MITKISGSNVHKQDEILAYQFMAKKFTYFSQRKDRHHKQHWYGNTKQHLRTFTAPIHITFYEIVAYVNRKIISEMFIIVYFDCQIKYYVNIFHC